MTPEQEKKLDRIVEAAHATELAVGSIKSACVPCSQMVHDHELMLQGPPGNGTRPGLKARVIDITSSLDDMRDAQLKQTKWAQRQLLAIITAFLAAMAAVVHNLLNGGTFP